MTDKKLKPCPFCGGEAEIRESKREHPFSSGEDNIFTVVCTVCGCAPFPAAEKNIYYKHDFEERKQQLKVKAAKLWNRRADK